jgi:hypothetical protein
MTFAMAALLMLPVATQAGAFSQPKVIELAPAPRETFLPVQIMAVKGGYQVYLNRSMAEFLREAIEDVDEKNLAAMLKKRAKEKKEGERPDEQAAATLEMLAFTVASQLPGFKKSMAEKMGPNGVIITLTGFQTEMVKFKKPRPRLEKAAEIVRGVMPLLPDEAQEVIEALRAVGRTKPIFWKVEPRE